MARRKEPWPLMGNNFPSSFPNESPLVIYLGKCIVWKREYPNISIIVGLRFDFTLAPRDLKHHPDFSFRMRGYEVQTITGILVRV